MLRTATRVLLRPLCRHTRAYATADISVIVGEPPEPPNVPSTLDSRILDALARVPSSSRASLPQLIQQYLDRSGNVLDAHLHYESRPSDTRRLSFESLQSGGTDAPVHLLAHVVQEGNRHKITLSSAFALNATGDTPGESLIISCAHTLEEIRRSPLLVLPSTPPSPTYTADITGNRSSGSLILSSPATLASPITANPILSVLSSLPRSDILIFACAPPAPMRTLPVSLYPAHPGTRVHAHFVAHARPEEEGWEPWIEGTWAKWVSGTVLGYRDFAGREAEPGTYDSLSHMLFTPPPTAGSSGGPIIDEESGAVVGVMLGSRMDSVAEGVRGWGVPSEAIFEMFSLPGLNLKK
ncbi:hypothetical protein EWM64_g9354 [Hericium alpestre]|uniref:Uncharacterized protein n=1 Tax=Hericium alpestre TaxID=135208 RepID=A0A4Y9ZMB8_9AGAM|nr:hypothetical protein EWM64_g9354 [Hericium alpestre]